MSHFIEKSVRNCNHFNYLRMKLVVLLISLTVFSIGAHANDVSCQSEIMKPKLSASLLIEEDQKPAKLTVAEAKLRLKAIDDSEEAEEEQTQQDESAQVGSEKAVTKKQSRLGGIFDILLPSKLRNPVR